MWQLEKCTEEQAQESGKHSGPTDSMNPRLLLDSEGVQRESAHSHNQQTSHDSFACYPASTSLPSNFSPCYSQQHCQYLHMGSHQCIIWPVALVYYTASMCFSAARSRSVLVYSPGSWGEQTCWTSAYTTFCPTTIKKAGLFTTDFITQPQSMELDNCCGQPRFIKSGTCFQHVFEFYVFITNKYTQKNRLFAKLLRSLQQNNTIMDWVWINTLFKIQDISLKKSKALTRIISHL